jgi:uncharacterized protein YegL
MKTHVPALLLVIGLFLAASPSRAASGKSELAIDNVVILLDCSGSMANRMRGGGQVKMDAAKNALKQVLRQIPQEVRVGLLAFGGANLPSEWLYPLGPRDDVRLARAIDLPQPGQGTPLGAYIKKAADRLLEEREKQLGYGTFRLLVVTDGEAQDQDLVNRFTPEVIARGIIVDVIGVAMDQQHTLATKAHSYRAAQDARALQRAIAEVFAEVRPSNDDTGAEAFAVIAPLPQEVALAAIHALTASGNQPIGVKSVLSPQAPPAGAAPAPPARQPSPAPPQKRSQRVPGGLWAIGLVALFVLGAASRKGKRARR